MTTMISTSVNPRNLKPRDRGAKGGDAHAAIIIARFCFHPRSPVLRRLLGCRYCWRSAPARSRYWWDRKAAPLPLPQEPYALTVRTGATLRAVAHELTATRACFRRTGRWWRWRACIRADRAINGRQLRGRDAGTTLSGLLAKLDAGRCRRKPASRSSRAGRFATCEALRSDDDVVANRARSARWRADGEDRSRRSAAGRVVFSSTPTSSPRERPTLSILLRAQPA